jgi:signal transduction histidine kinase
MFSSLNLDVVLGADFRENRQLVPSHTQRRPSKKINLPLWIITGACFLLGAVADFFSTHLLIAPADFMIALACFIPPLGLEIFQIQDRLIWWSGFSLFWCAQALILFNTGGVASPLFGGQMLFLFIVLGGMFGPQQLKNIFYTVLLHIGLWSILTPACHLTVPTELSQHQIVIQDVLVLISAFCTVLTMVKTTMHYESEYESQARRLTETQNHLCHAEKMAEIGKLVATTAHELAQPVQVIFTASSLMRKAANEPSRFMEIQQLSERMTEASDRLQRLLCRLREFSRKEPFVLKDFDLVESIRSVQMLSQYDLRWNGVDCRMELGSEPLWTRGDSMRVQQVVFNLINNARDACSGTKGAVVRVKAQAFRNWIRISIWNNGEAIPIHVQSKLFQPYFTTKKPGQGTGLGLTICQQLIEQHGGRILFSSQEGDTCFVVDLPKAIKEPSPSVDAPAAMALNAI